MYAGLIITYRIRPVMNIPAIWVTEITHLREPDFFVDEQRAGPYRFWHHQHILEEIEGGTAMRDIVHYALPFGLPGRIVHPFMVRPQLRKIFAFRRRKLEEMFGAWGG
jgi:ligand-binding SRPBCC domain-containing protein